MNTNNTRHVSVLLNESIDGLDVKAGDIYLDGTLGGAGHAIKAIERAGGSLTLIGLDRDEDALSRARNILPAPSGEVADVVADADSSESLKIYLELANFSTMDAVLDELGIAFVDKILLDLGLSSDQFEQSGRGFTFRKDEPLLMTFTKNTSNAAASASASANDETGSEPVVTASEIVNQWSQDEIADIIFKYGEENFAKRIAKAIVEAREIKPINTTFELVDIVKKATPGWYHHLKINPATKTFQALRIAVNDELGSLAAGMINGFNRLRVGGRMAIITFHSLEDRMVKQFYKEKVEANLARLVNKKPITPSREEVDVNPRSRSAKLRILEKI